MAPTVIVSYDDTDNDRDALALGGLLRDAGATVGLAYVRHALEPEPRREVLEEHEAEELLARGAHALGEPGAARYVVLNASTGEGLRELAEQVDADVVVFGSDYRTPPDEVRPGTSAERLLEGAPVAVAIAPAGLRDRAALEVRRIGALAEGDDVAAGETAAALAGALGARVVPPGAGSVDLLVLGSRAESQEGRVVLSAAASHAIDTATFPVLVVPRNTAVPFDAPTLAEP